MTAYKTWHDTRQEAEEYLATCQGFDGRIPA